MNIHFIDMNGCATLSTGEEVDKSAIIILGVNPPEDSLPEGIDRQEVTIVRWLPTIRLLFCLPCNMVLVERSDWPSQSAQSQALYPAYWEMPWRGQGGGVLLQLLSALDGNTIYTSRHHHRRTTERFYPVYGEVQIQQGDEDWKNLAWRTEVNPPCPHQLRVRDGFALTLIRMEGPLTVRGADCMDDHFYEAD